MQVEVARSGNLITFPADKLVFPLLKPELQYKHKTMAQGAERRQRMSMGLSPVEVVVRKLYEQVKGHVYCGAGLRSRVFSLLAKHGHTWTYTDHRDSVLPAPQFERLMDIDNVEFRHRQEEVLATIAATDGGLIGAPTGYGKTHLSAFVCKVYPDTRIAFVSSGLDLIESTFYRLHSILGGQVGRIGGGYCEPNKRVLLCSIDSLHKAPIEKVGLVIADEVHEMATDRRIGMLTSRYTDATFVGFSASLNMRMDNADAMLEAVFGPVIMDISYAEAQDASVVAPIRLWMVEVPAVLGTPTLSGESWMKQRYGYWRNSIRNQIIASAVRSAPEIVRDKDPQTLVMVSKIEHAFELRQYLPDFEIVYGNVTDDMKYRLIKQGLATYGEFGDKSRRASILRRFEKGLIRRVIATHCWKKGINPVQLKVFVRADGETSSINNTQLPGRLSRIYDGKDFGLLIDFNDTFDPWTAERSRKRMVDYARMGFKKIDAPLTGAAA